MRSAMPGLYSLGAHTPEAVGDYVGGSNHVLPTARSAKFSSGLNVLDYHEEDIDPEVLTGEPRGDRSCGRHRSAMPRVSTAMPARSQMRLAIRKRHEQSRRAIASSPIVLDGDSIGIGSPGPGA